MEEKDTFVEERDKAYDELDRLAFLHRQALDIYLDDKSQENYDAMVAALQASDKAFYAISAEYSCRKCDCCKCDEACCSKAAVKDDVGSPVDG